MQWDGYTIFSMLSGICLISALFIPDLKAKDRIWSVIGGVFFIGYAFYAGEATSGTFEFPVVIFIIPFIWVAYVIFQFYASSQSKKGTHRS